MRRPSTWAELAPIFPVRVDFACEDTREDRQRAAGEAEAYCRARGLIVGSTCTDGPMPVMHPDEWDGYPGKWRHFTSGEIRDGVFGALCQGPYVGGQYGKIVALFLRCDVAVAS